MDIGFKKVSVTKIEEVGIVTLNRPDIHNVLTFETFKEIDYALKLFESDEKIRVILFKANCGSTDSHKIFSAGVNLKEYDSKFKMIEENPSEYEKILKDTRSFMSRIENIRKPVIAGVDGLAVGGAFELILACDLILVSDEAQFVLSEIDIGLIPGYGGIQRLISSVGKKKTFEIVATGRKLTAQEALITGLVAEIYPVAEFNKRLIEFSRKLSQKPSQALALIKDTVNKLTYKALNDEIEIKNYMKAVSSEDAKEGITAFIEKRAPKFS